MDQQGKAARLPVVECLGDFVLVVTRLVDAPPQIVYRAWSQPELFRRWWVPETQHGITLVSCEMDVRTGGSYRLEYGAADAGTMAFHGKYLEVVPGARIVWTNDEAAESSTTTVTFEAQAGTTLVTVHEVYPSRAARDEALASSAAALPDQLDQLDRFLAGNDT